MSEHLGAALDGEAAALLSEAETLETPPPTAAEQAEIAEQAAETKQALVMVIGPAFSLLAPAWNVQDQEVEALADAYAALLDKYWPGGLQGFGVEINALLITLAVFGPRLKMPRKIEEKVVTEGEGDGAPS